MMSYELDKIINIHIESLENDLGKKLSEEEKEIYRRAFKEAFEYAQS
jgi:cation transport regulator ChaB